MTIKITIEKYVNEKGLAKARIISVENMLSKENLPYEYLANEPYAYIENSYIKSSKGCPDIWIGHEEEYEKIINCIEGLKPAGKRLKEINIKIAELKKTWTAKEVYNI